MKVVVKPVKSSVIVYFGSDVGDFKISDFALKSISGDEAFLCLSEKAINPNVISRKSFPVLEFEV